MQRKHNIDKKDLVIKNISKKCVYDSIESVMKIVKIRDRNYNPIRLTYLQVNICTVCRQHKEDCENVRFDQSTYLYGWYSCKKCIFWIKNFYKPNIFSKINRFCLESNDENIENIIFDRRSRTKKIYPYKQHNSNIISLRYNFQFNNRLLACVTWCESTIIYQKYVNLSNIIRNNINFPQSPREFLYLIRHSIITKKIFIMIIREYLLVNVWNKIEKLLNNDIMTIYGIFSDD